MTLDNILAATKWRIIVAFTALASFFAAVIMAIGTCSIADSIKALRDTQIAEREARSKVEAKLLANDDVLTKQNQTLSAQFKVLGKANPEIAVPMPPESPTPAPSPAELELIVPRKATPKPTLTPKVRTEIRYRNRPAPKRTPFKLFGK